MLIDFESSGGYANLQLSYHANTDTLPPDVAAEITRMVESSGVFDIQQEAVAPSPAGPPDVMTYHLSLRDGSRLTILTFNDVTVPTSLHPLLSLLRKLAVDEKMKGR
jgi:hypothetical protein